jgi:predicted RNA-binding protein with PUA-like domain
MTHGPVCQRSQHPPVSGEEENQKRRLELRNGEIGPEAGETDAQRRHVTTSGPGRARGLRYRAALFKHKNKLELTPQKFPAPHKPSPPTFPASLRTSAPPAVAGALKLTQRRMPRKAKSTAQAASTPATGAQYWLLKTEPGEWSWSDQARATGGTAPWDGVRNRQAMNYLRAMRPGDHCLFYHSGAGAASRRVVGVVEVARPWYEVEGEEEKAAAGGAVDVRAIGEFRQPVALGKIKKAADEVEGMRDFALLRQPRLSVMPVPAKVWDWICEMGGGFVQEGEVEEDED